MKNKINCGSSCVKYVLNTQDLSTDNIKNDMFWISELALSLKENGINNLEVLFFNSSLYNGYINDYDKNFMGFKLLDELVVKNIKLLEKKLTIKELIQEINDSKFIILCVESSKFNHNKNMSGGHFIIISKVEGKLVKVINPIKDKYEVKTLSKRFIINCCKHYGSWRILIKG